MSGSYNIFFYFVVALRVGARASCFAGELRCVWEGPGWIDCPTAHSLHSMLLERRLGSYAVATALLLCTVSCCEGTTVVEIQGFGMC